MTITKWFTKSDNIWQSKSRFKDLSKGGFDLEDQIEFAKQGFKVLGREESKHLSICGASKEQEIVNQSK